MLAAYARGLRFVIRHQPVMVAVTLATLVLSVSLFVTVPKGFFPQQDTGRLSGTIQAAEDISFAAMAEKQKALCAILMADPAVDSVTSFVGSNAGSTNTGRLFASLKPQSERDASADQVIARLRGPLSKVPGASLYLQAVQDVRAHRGSPVPVHAAERRSLGAHLLGAEAPAEAAHPSRGARRLQRPAQPRPADKGRDRPRHRLPPRGLALHHRRHPLRCLPALCLCSFRADEHHPGGEPPRALPGRDPVVQPPAGHSTRRSHGRDRGGAPGGRPVPGTIHADFAGAAAAFRSSLANEPLPILAALITVYVTLGVLYESTVHPITILSTLPSAGVGALLALLATRTEFSVIALVGVILLVGIVKKNAIMMIDFALDVERREHLTSEEAIYKACLLRFRPIMMTTMAALFGSLPLALGTGTGSELRRPLGISIVGGLLVSQLLTLYTTPVVYLVFERLQARLGRRRKVRATLAHAPLQS